MTFASLVNGAPIDSGGRVLTDTGTGAVDTVSNGFPYKSSGALMLTLATFFAAFKDAGSGVVNITTGVGTGAGTFTRATTAAARLATGLWNLGVAINSPRSHYLPSGEYGGYLSEDAATQLLLNPRDMTQAAWVVTNLTPLQNVAGIDGVASSCTRLTATLANATILQTITAAASTRTYSCYVKRLTGTGAIGICQDGVTFTDITALINSTTFTLIQLTASQLNAVLGFRISANGDAIAVDCNQFEAGAFATTPIPAAGTRGADVLTYPYTANVDTAIGTVYAELSTEWAVSTLNFAVASGALACTNNYALGDQAGAASTVIGIQDGVNAALATIPDMRNVVRRVMSTWGAAGIRLGGNGGAIVGGSFDNTLFNGITNLQIGCGNSVGQWQGTIKNVSLWKAQLSDADITAVTGTTNPQSPVRADTYMPYPFTNGKLLAVISEVDPVSPTWINGFVCNGSNGAPIFNLTLPVAGAKSGWPVASNGTICAI
jgi:hypothetical protein